MNDKPHRAVMVVEKDPNLRTLISDLLSGVGLPTITLEDGYDALDRARREQPALIITDILIPRLDGLSLCRLIKRDEALRETRVIVLSVLLAEDRALQSGADAFLQKPIEMSHFVAKLQSIVGGEEERYI